MQEYLLIRLFNGSFIERNQYENTISSFKLEIASSKIESRFVTRAAKFAASLLQKFKAFTSHNGVYMHPQQLIPLVVNSKI